MALKKRNHPLDPLFPEQLDCEQDYWDLYNRLVGLVVANFELSTGEKWDVVTNLPQYGINVQMPLEHYLLRAQSDATIDGFCEYIQAKDHRFFAMPETKFNNLLKN